MADIRRFIQMGVDSDPRFFKSTVPRWMGEFLSGFAGLPGDSAVLGQKMGLVPKGFNRPPTMEEMRPRIEDWFGYDPRYEDPNYQAKPDQMATDLGYNDIPGFAEGGRPEVGQPAIVGENGPELFVPDQPGTVIPRWLLGNTAMTPPSNTYLDRSLVPLFLQSAAQPTPPQPAPPMWLQSAAQPMPQPAPPMTRALPNYETTDPFELAAMRTRETVRPTAGRAGEGPTVRQIFDATLPGQITNAVVGLSPLQDALYGYAGQAGAKTRKFIEENFGIGRAQGAENPDLVKELQTQLRDLGYYRGPIDGRMGPATAEAKQKFDAAEAQKRADELATQNANAATATAAAQQKAAEAQLEAARLTREQQQYKEAGSERLKQLEGEVPWYRQALRDYGGPAGYAIGALLGLGTRAGVVAGSNKLSRKAAEAAEEMFSEEASGSLNRMARVNEFWRKGGAGDAVPFQMTPGSAPGFAANPNVAPMSRLYQPSRAMNATTDVGIPAAFGAESAYGQFSMAPKAHEELRLANEAAANDPSEVNLRRLQAAKDSVAIAEFMTNLGRGAGGTYAASSLKLQRSPTQPDMRAAEAERGELERYLRQQESRLQQAPSPTPLQGPAPTPALPRQSIPALPAPSGPPTIVRDGVTYELHPSGWRVQAGQPGGGRFMKNPPDWLTR
jgi:hypothetical protein